MHRGLRLLYDDKSCLEMSDSIVEGGVADIYIEAPHVHELLDDEEDADMGGSIQEVARII
uniref:Uncharacterized protein n=1 Tax=Arundo donax TaxID=35708 RepID=A0A0A8ZK24_ARUDO